MEQRLSLVVAGTRDLPRAKAFYEGMGWKAAPGPDDIAFFQLGGIIFGLYGVDALAAEANVAEPTDGFGGMALAYNGRTRKEVDSVLAEAVEHGGRLLKAAADTHWGGYSGYFSDPDGHVWEVAYNPFFPIDDDGAVRLPD